MRGGNIQAFVKFFGSSSNRAARNSSVRQEIERSGCHSECTYPRRPRLVTDGATIFTARLVSDPNDILIFGRAIANEHDEAQDKATAVDIALRPWRKHWRYYIRVHDTEFLSGTLGDGISLNELMDTLGPQSFFTTKRNLERGYGNLNPRLSITQQPDVQLTPEASAWLNEHLDAAFAAHGKISQHELNKIDSPEVQVG